MLAAVPGTLKSPVTTRVSTPWGDEYGYGCVIRTTDGQRSFGHSGGAPGINALFQMFPELGYTVVVLSNTDEGASRVGRRVAEMINRTGT